MRQFGAVTGDPQVERNGKGGSHNETEMPCTKDFVAAMRQVASPVYLLISDVCGRPWATTITSFTSISVDPPILMISVTTDSSSGRSLATAEHFTVSLLNEQQAELAFYGASRGIPRFLDRTSFDLCPLGSGWMVDGALHGLFGQVVRRDVVEDHTLVFARVCDVSVRAATGPLLYNNRTFRSLAKTSN
jgi:flavin reductase ActVB